MATRIDDLDKPYEINGHSMTHPHHGTAHAFQRAGYAVAGTCLGATVLRGHDDDRGWHWIEVDFDGRIVKPREGAPARSRRRRRGPLRRRLARLSVASRRFGERWTDVLTAAGQPARAPGPAE